MFHLLIVLYGLSLTEAYNIRITGKIELGNDFSKLYKELYPKFEGVPNETTNAHQILIGSSDNETANKTTTEYENDIKNVTGQELTVLDKMVQNEQENVHLYGNHKLKKDKDGQPLNTIHFASMLIHTSGTMSTARLQSKHRLF